MMTAPTIETEAPRMGSGRGHARVELGVIRHQPERLAIELTNPMQDQFAGFITANRDFPSITMVVPDSCRGKSLAICGAGPSLAAADITGVDDIFACNSALPYLMDRGVRVTGAVGIDQTPGLLREWQRTFDVPYYVASSCSPDLIAHLRADGRECRFFHNAVGIPDEVEFYKRTWPHPMFMVGQGQTVVSRFVYVARWMGYDRVDVYGADCALGAEDVAHANGEHVATAYHNPLIMQGVIDGRTWRTRPDMLRDAVTLARLVRDTQGAVRLMGDTLPVALIGKDDAFLDSVSRTVPPGELSPLTAPTE